MPLREPSTAMKAALLLRDALRIRQRDFAQPRLYAQQPSAQVLHQALA